MSKQRWSQKSWVDKPIKQPFYSILNKEIFFGLKKTNIMASCYLGNVWSISSDTHPVVWIQKETLLRWINNFKVRLFYNIYDTRVLGIKPSLAILRQTKHCRRLKCDAKTVSKQAEAKDFG